MSRVEAVLHSLLKTLLVYLTDDQRLKFNKIHKLLDEMSMEQLLEAIVLVEKTLDDNDVRPIRVLEHAMDKIGIEDDGSYNVE